MNLGNRNSQPLWDGDYNSLYQHRPMKNTAIESALPPNIESQLTELEIRHKRHQNRMEEQRLRKVDGPARHRARHFARSVIPITLV